MSAAGDGVDLVAFDARPLDDLVAMWRASFEAGVGIRDPHPIDEQKQYFLTKVLPHYTVRIALQGGRLIGFVAASAESVAQLLVRVGCQRRGIGTRMLAWAKERSAGSLWLCTFARNRIACAFHEREGFRVVARGFGPAWRQDDVTHLWTAGIGTGTETPC